MSVLYVRNANGTFVQIPSIPGKSAYEIAVEKGVFEGTEQEFAEMQVFTNKDILDQITQENIDFWNSGGNGNGGMTDEEKEQLANELDTKANKSDIPTKISQLTNDSGYLTNIPSEYITEEELNEKGYLTEHQDISNKVDKVSGKGLSTNDYTTAEKNKLANIEPGANKVIVYKASECTTFTSDSGTCTPLAVQKAVGMFPPKAHEHSQYLTEHQDISGKANKSDIPTKISQLTNDSGYLTNIPSEYITEEKLAEEISHIQQGMTDEEKEQLANELATKFDDVQLNEEETTDTQTALDFYSDGKIVKTVYFTGGGGGSSTSAYISTELEENVLVGTNENFDLTIDFVSPNPGKGTLKVFINDVEAVSKSIGQGQGTTVIEGTKFTKGTNRVTVYVIDRVGVMSNSLTFYVRYGSTEISSDFDSYTAYDYGATVRYYFTPTALDTSVSLTFYMSIDSEVQQGVSCTSDTRGYYTFPSTLSVGKHYCEAYIIDGNGMKSNVLTFNLIILDVNVLVVASDTKEVTVEEGEQIVFDYKVYMKNNTSFITKTYIDNNLANNGTCGLDFNYYRTSSLTEGIHTVKIEVWDITETYSDSVIWTVTITPSTYEMKQPINAGSMFVGTSVNRTNTDERKQYFIGKDQTGKEVLGNLYNFSYNSESGWVDDELIISGNSYVEIPIQPLSNNARYGFTLDIEFTSRMIGVSDAEVLTLWNEETNCGIKITTEELILRSSNGNECRLYFSDDTKTHVMFIIDRQELKAKVYINGVMCEAFHLNDYVIDGVPYLDDFTVNSNIILGGINKNGYCKIRNLRVYQVALTSDEIINNFISCEINKGLQKQLVEFQKGNDLPTLYVYGDFSGLGKDDKKPCKIIYNSTNVEKYGESFTLNHYESQLQYQGTSSMAYPIKNYRLNLRDEKGKKWYYNFPGGQGECRFTLKADFMSKYCSYVK